MRRAPRETRNLLWSGSTNSSSLIASPSLGSPENAHPPILGYRNPFVVSSRPLTFRARRGKWWVTDDKSAAGAYARLAVNDDKLLRDDEDLMRELPFALAAALRLRAAGANRDQIAAALDIPADAVGAQLELAARKLTRSRRERAAGKDGRPQGAG